MPYKDPEDQRRYQREWLRRRRAEFLAGKRCVDCGSTTDLEADHVDPSTKLSHHFYSWSEPRRRAEENKLAVRCTRCHRAKGLRNGELLAGARLRPDDVAAIRFAVRDGVSLAALANAFDVALPTVRAVVTRRTWSFVNEYESAAAANARDLGVI